MLIHPGWSRRSQAAGPVLLDQVLTEVVMPRLVVQREAGPLVDPPGAGQHVVGPQRDVGVPGPAREPEYLLDQLAADAEAPGPRLDQQQAQAGRGGVLPHAERAPGPRPVDLGDPGRLASGITLVHVVAHAPG